MTKVKVGDKIRVVAVNNSNDNYEIGDIYTVTTVWNLGLITAEGRLMYAHEYVLETEANECHNDVS